MVCLTILWIIDLAIFPGLRSGLLKALEDTQTAQGPVALFWIGILAIALELSGVVVRIVQPDDSTTEIATAPEYLNGHFLITIEPNARCFGRVSGERRSIVTEQ